MQSGFCTNCGRALTPGAAFCPSCGARVETLTAPAATTANAFPAATPRKRQSRGWVGWIVGCLVFFLGILALLIGLVVFGLLTHHLIFFAIGLAGLALFILIAALIEHLVRRLYLRTKYGIERELGMGGSYGARSGYRGSARARQQPRFSLIRFIFSLAIIAGLIYGGLYLYYTQQFVGDWSGVLTIGKTTQGVQTSLQIALLPHSPSNPSFSDLPSLTVTQVQFKTTSAQVCKRSGSYQLSGTASRLDASSVVMNLNTGKETVPLTGTYQDGAFHLSGTNAEKQTVSLVLEKGDNQSGYLSACGG